MSTAHPASSAVQGGQFENNYLAEMCCGSEAGSYLRLIDFVYHSTLGLRVIKKKKEEGGPAGLGVNLISTFYMVLLYATRQHNAERGWAAPPHGGSI